MMAPKDRKIMKKEYKKLERHQAPKEELEKIWKVVDGGGTRGCDPQVEKMVPTGFSSITDLCVEEPTPRNQ